MPCSDAASRLKAQARIALPVMVRLKNWSSRTISSSDMPDDPEELVADDDGAEPDRRQVGERRQGLRLVAGDDQRRRSTTICAASVARIITNMVALRSHSGRTTTRSMMTPTAATATMATAAATGNGRPRVVSAL